MLHFSPRMKATERKLSSGDRAINDQGYRVVLSVKDLLRMLMLEPMISKSIAILKPLA